MTFVAHNNTSMKRLSLLLAILSLTILTYEGRSQDTTVSYQSFYDDLSPYGQWINDSAYGYVWVPNVDDDFRPYFTNGHWVVTEYGNTWVSGYPWGWACFHYGRWMYNDYYGWVWLPGYEWGPGWVAWRWGDGICGWAPLYPGVVCVGAIYTCPADWWIFLHPRHLYKPWYHNHWRKDFYYGPRHTRILIGRTHYVTNVYSHGGGQYYSGPRTAEVQQVTHRPVQIHQYSGSDTRGTERIENNTIHTFRPSHIDRVNRDGSTPTPRQVIQAPRQVTAPGELRTNWNQPRQFKVEQQRQNKQWERPFMRKEPPYSTSPAPQPGRPSVRPAPRPSGNRPAPQVRPGNRVQPARPAAHPPIQRR